jgi:hypothetical protein
MNGGESGRGSLLRRRPQRVAERDEVREDKDDGGDGAKSVANPAYERPSGSRTSRIQNSQMSGSCERKLTTFGFDSPAQFYRRRRNCVQNHVWLTLPTVQICSCSALAQSQSSTCQEHLHYKPPTPHSQLVPFLSAPK